MKFFCCPNCDSRFHAKSAECPSCGEVLDSSSWKEVELEAPEMPDHPVLVELHGDLGNPFVFRRQPHVFDVGRPLLAAVSSQANCCERVQFVLSWEGERCFIAPPSVLPRNATYVNGAKLLSRTELVQGGTIDLRGPSGRTALPLTVIYS